MIELICLSKPGFFCRALFGIDSSAKQPFGAISFGLFFELAREATSRNDHLIWLGEALLHFDYERTAKTKFRMIQTSA